MDAEFFDRVERLFGRSMMERLRETRVLLVGVGGVGSWCAESLIRSGVGRLTLVDSDVVCASNVNRQLMATTATLGRSKVEALRERLLSISPQAEVTARMERYDGLTEESFRLEDYDFVIDAIDSLDSKMRLLLRASAAPCTLLSSMGAALKRDASRIRVDEFWKVKGDPLAASLRHRFRRDGVFPARPFLCVYSDEPRPQLPPPVEGKERANGSLVHITAIFGNRLCGEVLREVERRMEEEK